MSRLHGRIKRLEGNRQEEECMSHEAILEKFKQILTCATAIAEGEPLPHMLTRKDRELANQYAEEFRRSKEREEAARAGLAYLLLSERDATVLIGSRERREHLQEAYRWAIQEKSSRAIWDYTGLIGHRDRTPEEEAQRSEMLDDLVNRAEHLRQKVASRTERKSDPLRSWTEAEEEAFYVNSEEYLRKTHPEWYRGR
jgi:hypothetical protein